MRSSWSRWPQARRRKLVVQPHSGVDLGNGRGKTFTATIHGGVVGVAFDGRGRPLEVPTENRSAIVARWAKAFDAYPS